MAAREPTNGFRGLLVSPIEQTFGQWIPIIAVELEARGLERTQSGDSFHEIVTHEHQVGLPENAVVVSELYYVHQAESTIHQEGRPLKEMRQFRSIEWCFDGDKR